MGLTLTEKILGAHLISGHLKPGEEISIRIDHTLTQDATGTMACLQFEALRIPKVKTELSVNYIDHNVLQLGFENADDHLYLKTVSEKYGMLYSKPGNGVCHQLHLERFGQPGKTLLGSDSHTPTGGGIGMLAIGAGGLDIAIAMGGGAFFLASPKVIKVELIGKLSDWVSAKDIILALLQTLTTKGNVGTVIEYSGEGVKTLSIPERATITNMGAELGVTTSLFPSDDKTREFLKAQDREDCWVPLCADSDAEYYKVIEINLSKLEPMIAKPHSPDNVVKLSEIEGLKVDQVGIGSCTNAGYKDLATVAEILKGRKVHRDVTLIISPASRQVLKMITDNNLLTEMVKAGARIAETNCGFCIGQGHVPATGSVSLRTINRNFKGRCGTPNADVYLVSPQVAVVSAIEGKITDPRKYGVAPVVNLPAKYDVDDSMVLKPSGKSVEIFRGPNIGDPPSNVDMAEDLAGTVLLKVGDKITTDHIMPAGNLLKFRSNIPKYSEYVFEPVDLTFPDRAKQERDRGNHGVIVGGESYGQGSSREHAALCPMFLGIKAVLAKSIERIHTANLINFGILPLTFVDKNDYDLIEQGDSIEIKNVRDSLSKKQDIILVNKTKDKKIPVCYSLSDRQINIILEGGLLNYTRKL